MWAGRACAWPTAAAAPRTLSADFNDLGLEFLSDEMRRKRAFLHNRPFEPPAGNLETIDLNNGHPVRGIGNQMHDVAYAELHGYAPDLPRQSVAGWLTEGKGMEPALPKIA